MRSIALYLCVLWRDGWDGSGTPSESDDTRHTHLSRQQSRLRRCVWLWCWWRWGWVWMALTPWQGCLSQGCHPAAPSHLSAVEIKNITRPTPRGPFSMMCFSSIYYVSQATKRSHDISLSLAERCDNKQAVEKYKSGLGCKIERVQSGWNTFFIINLLYLPQTMSPLFQKFSIPPTQHHFFDISSLDLVILK